MVVSQTGVIGFIHRTYAWMTAGLLVTSIIAYMISASQVLSAFFLGNPIVFYGAIVLELAVVFYFSFRVQKMSSASAGIIFIVYSLLNGITFALLFLLYTASSIALTFIVTAGVFGLMSLYGYLTKRDLTTAGNIALMALIGIIVASVVNFFLNSIAIYWITTYAGVLIFVVLIARDTQKLRKLYTLGESTLGGERKEAIVGALTLYLDFINLFIDLLRIFGRRRS